MNDWPIQSDPSADEMKFLDDQLENFNKESAGFYDFKPLHLILRNESGDIVAGLKAITGWGWLHISTLWVHEDQRGNRFGSRLLEQAEREARGRGCQYACLTTFTFQSPRFYERHGYLVFGTLDDYPAGKQLIFLKKRLPSGVEHG